MGEGPVTAFAAKLTVRPIRRSGSVSPNGTFGSFHGATVELRIIHVPAKSAKSAARTVNALAAPRTARPAAATHARFIRHPWQGLSVTSGATGPRRRRQKIGGRVEVVARPKRSVPKEKNRCF